MMNVSFLRGADGMRLAQAEIKSRNLFSISHGSDSRREICPSVYPQRFQRAPIKKGKHKRWLTRCSDLGGLFCFFPQIHLKE